MGEEFGSEVETGLGQPGRVIKKDQRVDPDEEIELLWVEEATEIAKRAAQKSGWENVAWE